MGMWYNAPRMKKGFTLVELLIVVVVIVTLMTISFRITGAGGDAGARNATVNRMQRLENCLSGYYAAYGCYPPVRLHGSRDYMIDVDGHGIQQVGKRSLSGLKGQGSSAGSVSRATEISWERVEAACKSQPIGMAYPFTKSGIADYIKKVSDMLIKRSQSDDPKDKEFKENPALAKGFRAITDEGMLSSKRDDEDWTDVQIFKFGVLSYLLPRYLIMLGGESNMDSLYENQKSWKANNRYPCRFEDGVAYSNWGSVNDDVRRYRWKIAALSSQAVCARWLPNLERSLRMQYPFEVYGVQLQDPDNSFSNISANNPHPVLYSTESQGGKGSNSGDQYVLDEMTVVDGWKNEFYYYSPPPHQSYILWSAGKNGKTFPQWVSDEEIRKLTTADQAKVMEWKGDDIVKMSH